MKPFSFIIFLLTINKVAGWSKLVTKYCPTHCQCNLFRIFCQNRALSQDEFVRLGNESNHVASEVVFQHQNITTLDMCIFKKFTNLQKFIFTHSALKEIPRNLDCIKGRGVSVVQINDNQITEIKKDDLKGYERVIRLYLNNNKIKNLRANTFSKLKQVFLLQLDSNVIESIEPGTFNGLKDLQALYLEYNQLTTITNNVFQAIKRIGHLYLDNNKISMLADQAFAHLQMVTLRLQNNRIVNIPPEVFTNTSIDTVVLSNNPIHCSCKTLLTFENVGYTTVATCTTPITFKGKSVSEVIRIVTDPCNKKLHCRNEDPVIVETLYKKYNNGTVICPTQPPVPNKSQEKLKLVLYTSVGVLVLISLLSFIIGYNYKKRVTGTAQINMDVNLNGFQTADGTYVRDTTHYVETLDEPSKDVTIKSVRRKISTAIFGPPRKQSLPNTAIVNGTPASNGVGGCPPRRKKNTFLPQPSITEEENGANQGFEKD
ncbi:leucine-rich repeat-containing protein 70-like [Clytia hemisphaerica]|uniref:Leucine rich repeat containing protein n=1 Tax=Clytia hemisphaerica TaxID=252671 RepID=A0A7M5V271_9CNID|eukprot:TCONS_00037641-protein